MLKPMTTTHEPTRIRDRRRVALAAGAMLLLACSAIACIFDDGGNYQGGGRRETAVTATQTATQAPTAIKPPAASRDATVEDTGTTDN
jgi:hypothetical protein